MTGSLPPVAALAELPIATALGPLADALAASGQAVLVAPPGAGKTTAVPLALATETQGRIIVAEPRRLAARAAAERMAELLGERAGASVGWRVRGEARVSAVTRIEVVTEGILLRMLQDDPALEGVGAVILDEFHERSLDADLALAFALEAREALRPDLRLVVMSATLDAAAVAGLMQEAPVVTAEGRSHPVEVVWAEQALSPAEPLAPTMARVILDALADSTVGVLAFLPGEAEIARTGAFLAERLPADVTLHHLTGAMALADQRRAILPAAAGRKLVLATNVAETSLTIEGIDRVVDSGRVRRARFDPRTGLTRLVTERVSRAEAEQRAGRAGRLGPGRAWRLWTRGEHGTLPAHRPAEIETADLARLVLEAALWGTAPEELRLLSPPPAPALAEARALLRELGAIDEAGRPTAHGRAMGRLPLHPRLAHLGLRAGRAAAPLAALTTERDPLIGAPAELALRLETLADPDRLSARRSWRVNRGRIMRIRQEARRLARMLPDHPHGPTTPGAMAALAWPERVARRRPGPEPRFLLASGRGARLAAEDPLAAASWIVAVELDGDGTEARIRLAAATDEAEIRAALGDRIRTLRRCAWNRRARAVEAVEEERLGAIVLNTRPWRDCPAEARLAALLEGLSQLGLAALDWSAAARRLRARIRFARSSGAQELPPEDDAALLAEAEDWLAPWLADARSAEDLGAIDPFEALRQRLGREGLALLDRIAPEHWQTPLGRRVPIDYESGTPTVSVRLQELFGTAEHPRVGRDRRPLRIEVLSPAGRPVQVTTDLPAFWRGSYAEVRREMRGRYPKHPWPEDPLTATPTLRARGRRR